MPRQYVKANVELITPKMAEEMLKCNTHNRRISQTTIDRFSRDMAAGKWDLTGESIIFDSTGILSDGQHRLLACIAAGRSFKALVVRGTDKESRTSIGSGRPRSNSDNLEMANVLNATDVAAALNVIWQWNQVPSLYLRKKGSPTRHESAELFASIPDMETVVSETRALYQGNDRNVGPSSLVAGVFLILRQIDKKTAAVWRKDLLVGAELSTNDPCFVLRRMLGRDKSRDPITQVAKRYYLVRCWNAMRSDEVLAKYQYNGQLDIEAV